jgi:hypothetical protein
LRVARGFVGVRKEMPHEAPVALVFDGSRVESFAKRFPGRRRVEREARVGRSDRQNEAGAEAFAEARWHDKPALVIKGELDPAGKARQIACQGKTSTQTHQLPLATTITPHFSIRKATRQSCVTM